MANRLNEDLTNRHVVLTRDAAPFEEIPRRVMVCKNGNGLDPMGIGRAVYGMMLTDENQTTVPANGSVDIERFAADEEVEQALAIRKAKVGW